MKNMKIVDLKEIPEIIPILAKWHHDQWAYLNPQSTLEGRIEKYHEYCGEEFIPSTYVACRNSDILGSASIIKHDMKTRMEYSPWLASVFVPPRHRNNGIGTRLVCHVMSIAEENNFDSLYLFTPDKERFYLKLGWTTIHKEFYSDTQVFIMSINFREKQT